MPTNISDEPTLTDPEFDHPVRVCWGQGADTIEYWNEMCIASIDMFGCPGDRYVTDIGAESMTWSFRSSHDALIFRLRFGEVVT